MSPAASAAAPTRALSRDELLRRPVSGREVVLRDDESIVSTTDPRGVITSVNSYFVEISGYTEAELIGQPHHLIRHPEMPAAAFADMWAHIKKGRPWIGLVKNRCKNGDHYWVQANVTPVVDEAGQISGYMSLRRKASAEQIAAAERAYAAIRAHPTQAVEIVNGRVGKPSLQRLNPLWRLNLTVRLYLLSGFGVGLSALLMLLGEQGWSSADRWLIWAAGLGFALYSAFWLSGDVVGRLDAAKRAFRHIAAGNFREPIDVSRNDEIGSVLLALKSLQIRLGHQVEQLAHEHRAAARINQGLDVAATNIMVADRRFNIVFANRALLATFRKHETILGSVWPGFRAEGLVGSNIDRFHRDPAHQRRMLPALRSPHRTRIELVGLSFDLTVTPVAGQRGDNIGYVVEWLDRTDELAIEREIEHVVEGASHGQLDRRINEAGKSGHVLHLSQGINRVLGSVTEAIGAIQKVLAALAQGDLRQRVSQPLEGAFGAMARDANSTVDTLADIVGRIQEAVGVITTAASEIAAGNTDLSERTEQQAANLEETASSMEELTATVQQNASSARSARGLAEGVSQIARRGGEVVGGAVQTMSEVTKASKKIEEIISVMDGVAFQTNILALNAAVEAARAGEMGRGFAVVASEVRSLAQRSAESAKEIKQLISSSVQAVTTGARQVNEAGHAISELVAEVGKVSGLVAEISAASDEQAEGIGTVNTTITQLDNATQQNAALVEQATAAARSMEQQASELADAVSRFRIG